MGKKSRLKKIRQEAEEYYRKQNSCPWCGSGPSQLQEFNNIPGLEKYKPTTCGSIPGLNRRGVICRIQELENKIKQLESIIMEDDNEQTQEEEENTKMSVV